MILNPEELVARAFVKPVERLTFPFVAVRRISAGISEFLRKRNNVMVCKQDDPDASKWSVPRAVAEQILCLTCDDATLKKYCTTGADFDDDLYDLMMSHTDRQFADQIAAVHEAWEDIEASSVTAASEEATLGDTEKK